MRGWPKKHATGSRWEPNSCPECWWEEVPWWYTSKEMQGHRRTSSLKKEGRHLKRWTYYDNTLQCIQRKTIVSPSLHKSSQHLISASHPASAPSSSTGAQGGIRKLLPLCNHPQPPSPLPNHVWQFVTQGRSKFLIQNCPFWLLLKFSKSKFPFFSILFTSKFNT